MFLWKNAVVVASFLLHFTEGIKRTFCGILTEMLNNPGKSSYSLENTHLSPNMIDWQYHDYSLTRSSVDLGTFIVMHSDAK